MIRVYIFLAASLAGYVLYGAWGAVDGAVLGLVLNALFAYLAAYWRKEPETTGYAKRKNKSSTRQRPITELLVEDKNTIFASFTRKISQTLFSEKFWFTFLDMGQLIGNVLATTVITLIKFLGVILRELFSYEEDSPNDEHSVSSFQKNSSLNEYNENPLGQFFGESDKSPEINLTSGLPMMKGSCFDIAGNLYLTDSSHHLGHHHV